MSLSQTRFVANHCNVHVRQHTTVIVVDPEKLKCLPVLLLLHTAVTWFWCISRAIPLNVKIYLVSQTFINVHHLHLYKHAITNIRTNTCSIGMATGVTCLYFRQKSDRKKQGTAAAAGYTRKLMYRTLGHSSCCKPLFKNINIQYVATLHLPT